jgi:hypothetical protein
MRQFWSIGYLLPLCLTQLVAPGDQDGPSPFAHIEYKHERTFLNVDVMQLDITVADEVGREVERLVAAYHEAGSGPRAGRAVRNAAAALEESIASPYLHTPAADVSMLFLRSVSHRQFMGGRDDALEAMVDEELLTEVEADALTEDTDQLFAFVRSAPLRSGDEIRYSVRRDTVRTWVIWEDGTVALDIVRTTRPYRLYTMGSLFARGTEFRNGLIETVLDPELAAPRAGNPNRAIGESTAACLVARRTHSAA